MPISDQSQIRRLLWHSWPPPPFLSRPITPSNHLLQCFEGHSSTPDILDPLWCRWQPASQHLSLSGFLTLEGNRSVYFLPRERLSRGNQGSLQAQGLPSCSPITHKHPLSRSCLDNGWYITLHELCVHLQYGNWWCHKGTLGSSSASVWKAETESGLKLWFKANIARALKVQSWRASALQNLVSM